MKLKNLVKAIREEMDEEPGIPGSWRMKLRWKMRKKRKESDK